MLRCASIFLWPGMLLLHSAPMHNLPTHLQLIVESLCKDGCIAVNAYITSIENGEAPPVMQDLTVAESKLVLRELKSIMAVYDRRNTDSLP